MVIECMIAIRHKNMVSDISSNWNNSFSIKPAVWIFSQVYMRRDRRKHDLIASIFEQGLFLCLL